MASDLNGRIADGLMAIAVRDRIIYAILVVLLALLSFLGVNIFTRLGTLELLMRDVTSTKGLYEQLYRDDHALLITIEASRQQRTIQLEQIERRMGALEQLLYRMPSKSIEGFQ